MGLQEDEAFYQQLKPDLIPDMLGQFVLIANAELVEVFPTYQDAFDHAIAQGLTPGNFLIKEVTEDEPVETI